MIVYASTKADFINDVTNDRIEWIFFLPPEGLSVWQVQQNYPQVSLL
ncbi:MAG: hypothetical protein R6U62_07410 [Bacteroidales bacterium]